MKNNIYIYLFIIIICISLIIYSNKKVISLEKECSKYDLIETQLENLKFKSVQEWKNGGHFLNDIMLYDMNDSITYLHNLVESDFKFIFKYTELSCVSCLNLINNYLSPELKSKFTILTSYKEQRTLDVFARMNKINYPIYNLYEQKVNIPLDKTNVPYLFVLDNDLRVNYIFIPDKDFPEITTSYLNRISKLISN